MRKRIWAVLLSVCLLVGLLPTTALAGGLSTVKTYADLVASLKNPAYEIYLEPAADFGWPETGTLSIPANTQIVVVDENEEKAPWEIPSGITVNFERNTHGISCSTLTVNGTMHMAYSAQDAVLRGCDKVIIGPTCTFSCADDNPEYPTVYGAYIPVGSTWEVKEGGTLNPHVRLDGTLTGEGTVSGQVEVSGGFSGTAANATLSGNLTLTGGLYVGRENSSYADQLTISAGSHIKSNSGTTISHATVYLNGIMEWEEGEYSDNASIAAGGKIVMGGGKLIFNTPCQLRQSVFEWEDGEEMTYEKVRDAITEPLVDGPGVIRFNDKVSEAGQEHGRIMDCDADLVARTAQQVKAGTYVVENANALTWEPYYAIDLVNIDIERSWACDHTWDDGEVTTEPTCTQTGVKTYTCSKCGSTRTEEIEAKGHTAVTDAAVAATCTETGLTEGSHCSVCKAVLVKQTVIPALGHAWSTNNCAEEATCTREGCDATRAAVEHVWGDWTVTKEATCTEAGSRTHTCTSCKVEASEAITALGHSYSSAVTAPTCTEKGYTTHTCSRCGNSYQDSETATLGHDWGEWVVTKEPTETEDGSQTRVCRRAGCGATETESISKLEKQKVYWTINSVTWTYGQTVSAQNTAYNDSENGGALSYSSSDTSVATVDNEGKATIVGAGTTTITATAAAAPGKYAETSASYTLTINKTPLTITANNAAITYGQVPAGNGWTGTGYVYEEGPSVVTGTASYFCDYEQYEKTGTYEIRVSGLSAKNYDITYAPGTLTVSKATDYTITLGNLSQRDDNITAVTASVTPQDATAQIKVEYQVDGTWTTSLPTAAGEYQVRASLTGSDNIQTDSAYTTDTLTIQQSIAVDGTDVSVTVDGSKAEITVTEDELADIVDNADGDVSINLDGVEGVDELVLPGSLLEALSESTSADSLTVSTEDASISMSGAVLDTVASAVTGEDTVAVKLTAVEKEELTDLQKEALDSITRDAVIVEVSLVITHADGSPDTELHQLGGNVEVTVPYAGAVPEGKYIVVCYLSDDGNVTYVRATYNAETQQVTFTTNHFSNYAVFVSGKPASSVTVSGGSGSGIYLAGDTVTIKADSKSGYTFAGWEVVSDGITLTDSKANETTFTMPAANVELRATYTKITSGGGGGGVSTYTLTFDTNGGSKIDSVSKTSGTTIDLAGYITTRAGYDFDGWYSDAKLTDEVTSVKLTKNMTVYAKWTEKGGENPFVDVADDAYYADAVIWAVGKGITSGTTAATFSPNAPCTRAQAVTFLWRAAGSPEPESMSGFADVSADSYYAKAVAWAVENGITRGTSDTTFSPNATCTRAQIVTFLWRSQKSPAADGVNPFTDVAADAYYADAVLWAAENGVTSGTTATTFSPNSDCTRAQIVTFLFRCLGVE